MKMLKFEENGEILKLSCFFFMTKNVSLSAADPIVKKNIYKLGIPQKKAKVWEDVITDSSR